METLDRLSLDSSRSNRQAACPLRLLKVLMRSPYRITAIAGTVVERDLVARTSS